MKTLAARLSGLCLFALALTSVDATEDGAWLADFAGGLQTYRADFQQEVLQGGRIVETSSGSMALMAPNRLRWHYREPFEQLIVADGETVFVHDVELEQVTVKRQNDSASSSPLYALTDPDRLAERFQVIDRGDFHGTRILALLPRDGEAEFEWVELGLKDQLLESIVIQDAFGQQTRIGFLRPQRNLELDETAFRFTPPPGVDVIGQDEIQFDDADIDF